MAVVRGPFTVRPANSPTLCVLLAHILAMIAGPCIAANGDWVMPAHDYASTRFSELAEIDTGNVRRDRCTWVSVDVAPGPKLFSGRTKANLRTPYGARFSWRC
jgi:hypothetical protein